MWMILIFMKLTSVLAKKGFVPKKILGLVRVSPAAVSPGRGGSPANVKSAQPTDNLMDLSSPEQPEKQPMSPLDLDFSMEAQVCFIYASHIFFWLTYNDNRSI